jgi:hypothetical protein
MVLLAILIRLTEHRDAESVPRAVASVAPEAGYWRESRSLSLAVLIRRFITPFDLLILIFARLATNRFRQFIARV